MIAAPLSGEALSPLREDHGEVVEVSLLLTASRLQALMNLSRCRGESVGELLRDLIDEAIDQRGLGS